MVRRNGGEAARQRAWGRTQSTATTSGEGGAHRDGAKPPALPGATYLTPCEVEALDGILGFDPGCRFAADGFELGLHACTRRDGRLVEPGDECHMEQRAQLAEQGRIDRYADLDKS